MLQCGLGVWLAGGSGRQQCQGDVGMWKVKRELFQSARKERRHECGAGSFRATSLKEVLNCRKPQISQVPYSSIVLAIPEVWTTNPENE